MLYPLYYGNWSSEEDMLRDFSISKEEMGECSIYVASYEQESYDGSAFVLFAKDGKLYEVHGSHCSCYGLEGMWEPEETSFAALERRAAYGAFATHKEEILAAAKGYENAKRLT